MTVVGIDITPGGEHVAAFDRDGRVLVLGRTGAEMGRADVSGLTGAVVDVATEAGASRVALATDQGDVAVVDVRSGRQIDVRTLATSPADVSWLGSGRDGILLVVDGSGAATYSAASGAEIARFPGTVYAAGGIENGRVVTSHDDRRLRVWDARTAQTLAESSELPGAPFILQPHGTSVVGVSRSSVTASYGHIVVWDWQAGPEPVRHAFSYLNDVLSAAVDDTTGIIQVAHDKEVWGYGIADGVLRTISPQQADWVTDVALRPGGGWMATAGADGRVLVWFTRGAGRPARPTYELLSGGGSVSRVGFLNDGEALVSLAVDGTLRMWDLPQPPRFEEHFNWVLDMDLSRDGRWLVTAGTDGYGYVLDPSDLTTGSVAELGWGESLAEVRFDPSDPHRVFTLGQYGTIPSLWRWSVGATRDVRDPAAHALPVARPPRRESGRFHRRRR